MIYTTDKEIEELVERLTACTLPRHQWTHQAHLAIALWYLMLYPKLEAIALIRTRIQCYNAALGIETTEVSGYHETITQFWIHWVYWYLTNQPMNESLVTLFNRLIQDYGDRGLIFQYYSHDLLSSWQARTTWVEPDLQCLPFSHAAMLSKLWR